MVEVLNAHPELYMLRLLRPGGSHHRGGTSIGAPASRLPVAFSSTDPGTNGPLSVTFLKKGARSERPLGQSSKFELEF